MTRKCALKRCSSRLNKNVALFSVPKDGKKKELWINFIMEQNKLPVEGGSQYLCVEHFSSDSWKRSNDEKRVIALPGAVPTIGCDKEVKIGLEFNQN